MAYPSVVPDLLDALFERAKAELNPDVQVYDGVEPTNNISDYLMIGVDDPDGPDWARSASTQREFETVGHDNDITEIGDIACAAVSWNGDGDQSLARRIVYGIAESLAGICRTDPTLGVDRLMWTLYGANSDLLQIQSDAGALARLEFQVHFQSLI